MQNDLLETDNKVSNKPRGRWVLILMFLFFALPLLLVVAMHKYDWHPQGGKSHGELISPARSLKISPLLLDVHGAAVNPELWHDKWSMVYIANDCQQACQDRLHAMRQLHASLAKDIGRVQRVLLTSSSDLENTQKLYPDLIILNQPMTELASLRQQFDLAGAPAGNEDRIYLVDPLGNLMMNFPTSIADVDIRKDLIRLLAYAWAG